MAALRGGYLVIPVLQYEVFYRDDFQLSLVEHYILKIRHLKNVKTRLRNDFRFLLTKIERTATKQKFENKLKDDKKDDGGVKEETKNSSEAANAAVNESNVLNNSFFQSFGEYHDSPRQNTSSYPAEKRSANAKKSKDNSSGGMIGEHITGTFSDF